MQLIRFIEWLRKIFCKPCKHQFNFKEVIDWNVDPRCIHCGHWLSNIQATTRVTLVVDLKDNQLIYTAKKL